MNKLVSKINSIFTFTSTTLIVLTFLTSCTDKDSSHSEKKQELNIAIWSNYITNEALKEFSEASGLKVNVMNYASNEELLAKIQASPGSVDLAIPSDYMVEIMSQLQLLEPLNKNLIENAQKIDKNFLSQPYDKQNTWSLPYAWAVTGIVYNKKVYPKPISSWKDFLQNNELKGKIALLDDVRESTGAILKMQGESINSTDKTKISQAKSEFLKVRKNIKMFSSDTIEILRKNEVLAAQAYSPDALQIIDQNPDYTFVIPSEGTTRSIDNFVIFKSAKNVEGAHRLIQFLLNPDKNLEFVLKKRGGPVVSGVVEKLSKTDQSNPAISYDPAIGSKWERIQDLGEQNILYEELWTEVKTQ